MSEGDGNGLHDFTADELARASESDLAAECIALAEEATSTYGETALRELWRRLDQDEIGSEDRVVMRVMVRILFEVLDVERDEPDDGQPPRGEVMEALDRSAEWGEFLEALGPAKCHACLRQAAINLTADALGRIVHAGEFGPEDHEQIRKLARLLGDLREEEPPE